MSVCRIKKGDTVTVTKGADAGKTGKVLQVLPERGRALVEGLRLVKKTLRKTQDRPQGGIVDKEASIALPNLMPFCPACKKGVRISRVREGGRSVRKCRTCQHAFEA